MDGYFYNFVFGQTNYSCLLRLSWSRVVALQREFAAEFNKKDEAHPSSTRKKTQYICYRPVYRCLRVQITIEGAGYIVHDPKRACWESSLACTCVYTCHNALDTKLTILQFHGPMRYNLSHLQFHGIVDYKMSLLKFQSHTNYELSLFHFHTPFILSWAFSILLSMC